ncbi:hypothetical protein [Enterococcus canintestini]|uniref:hypothetical protein n=1 Tax=Enterococcus canintestini TaxID=317010 RepID=UPI0035EC0C4F
MFMVTGFLVIHFSMIYHNYKKLQSAVSASKGFSKHTKKRQQLSCLKTPAVGLEPTTS